MIASARATPGSSGYESSCDLTLLGTCMRLGLGGSIPLVLLDEGQPSDDVFVEHAHQTSSFFIAGPDVGPQPFIASPDLGSHRRKLTANFLAHLQELRFEAIHPSGQHFEAFHATLQAIYATGKSLLRHRRHLDCGNCSRTLVPATGVPCQRCAISRTAISADDATIVGALRATS